MSFYFFLSFCSFSRFPPKLKYPRKKLPFNLRQPKILTNVPINVKALAPRRYLIHKRIRVYSPQTLHAKILLKNSSAYTHLYSYIYIYCMSWQKQYSHKCLRTKLLMRVFKVPHIFYLIMSLSTYMFKTYFLYTNRFYVYIKVMYCFCLPIWTNIHVVYNYMFVHTQPRQMFK